MSVHVITRTHEDGTREWWTGNAWTTDPGEACRHESSTDAAVLVNGIARFEHYPLEWRYNVERAT